MKHMYLSDLTVFCFYTLFIYNIKGSPVASSPLTQMVSGLVGQLLMPLHTGESPDPIQFLFQMLNLTGVIS